MVIFTSSFSHFFFFDSRGSLASRGSPSLVSLVFSFTISLVEAEVEVRDRSSFSTVAATSGDGHASASSKAGGAVLFAFVERRAGVLTKDGSARQTQGALPSDLDTPFGRFDDVCGRGAAVVGGLGTDRSIASGTGCVS